MSSIRVIDMPGMSKKERRTYLTLLTIAVALITAFWFWWIQPAHIPHNFTSYWHIIDVLLFACVTYVVWYQIVNSLQTWFVAGFMKKPVYIPPEPGLRVAFITAFVPGKEPYEMLIDTLTAMKRNTYPHDTWVLDEGDDPVVKEICRRLNVFHFSRKRTPRYNTTDGPFKTKSKGGNYNAWFDAQGSRYDIAAQMDVDFTPSPDYLERVLGYFRDPLVAFVGTPQIYGNTAESWIVRGAAQQAYAFYGAIQKGLYGLGMQLFIGANHAIRVAAHDSIDGYAGHIVEDHLTGMKLYAKRWKSVYVGEPLAVGEGPSTWQRYFSQQTRWAYGLIDILFRHSPGIFPHMKLHHTLNYYLLQQYYFYGLVQIVSLTLLVLYFFFGLVVTPMNIGGLLIFYIAYLSLDQYIFLWLQRFNIYPQTERGFMGEAKILNLAVWPVYFLSFIGVLFGKKLTYVVTEKGLQTNTGASLSVFMPHICIGSVSALCLAAAFAFHRFAPLLMFWAALMTVSMFAIVISELAATVSWNAVFKPMKQARYAYTVASVVLMLSAVIGIPFTPKTVNPLPEEAIISPIADIQPQPAQASSIVASVKTPRTIIHTVKPGESLWKIADSYYGDGRKWNTIHHSSQTSVVQPGEQLVLSQ